MSRANRSDSATQDDSPQSNHFDLHGTHRLRHTPHIDIYPLTNVINDAYRIYLQWPLCKHFLWSVPFTRNERTAQFHLVRLQHSLKWEDSLWSRNVELQYCRVTAPAVKHGKVIILQMANLIYLHNYTWYSSTC